MLKQENCNSLGKKSCIKKLNFEELKPFRQFINNTCKNIPRLSFIDEIDFFMSQS